MRQSGKVGMTRPEPGSTPWQQCASAAKLRLLGKSQAAAAKGVGVSRSTVARWEACGWWADVLRDALDDEQLTRLRAEAFKALWKLVTGAKPDARTVRFVIERLDPAFRPPAQRTELSGPDGGPFDLGQLDREIERMSQAELLEALKG